MRGKSCFVPFCCVWSWAPFGEKWAANIAVNFGSVFCHRGLSYPQWNSESVPLLPVCVCWWKFTSDALLLMAFFPFCRYGLGMIYYKQEKFSLAEMHFQKALDINPQSSVLLCHIGVVSRLHSALLVIFWSASVLHLQSSWTWSAKPNKTKFRRPVRGSYGINESPWDCVRK